MTKRLLLVATSILMLVTILCAVPVSATELPANIGTDYVAGTVTGNMFTADLSTTNVLIPMYTPDSFTANVNAAPAGSWYLWTKAAVLENTATGIGGQAVNGLPVGTGVAGVYVDKSYLNTNGLAAGDGLVVAMTVKQDRATPMVKAALTLNGKSPLYPKEYPEAEDGYTVTSLLTQVGNTFKLPDDWAGISSTQIGLGFPYPNISTADKRVILQRSSLYIGKEYAYDISVTADNTTLSPGSVTLIDADVLNQVGSTGYLSQNVTWYALNEARDAVVPGINIVAGNDGEATVSVSNSVEAGTYCLVAVASANSELVKGINITVENIDYSDYVAGDVTGNLITSASSTILNGSYVPDSFSPNPLTVTAAGTDDEGYQIWTKADVKETTKTGIGGTADSESRIMGSGVGGSYFNKGNIDTTGITAGSAVIIGAQVKKDRGTPIINAAIGQTGKTPIFSQEYPTGIGGESIDATSWEDVSFTLKIPETGWMGIDATQFYFGFAYTGIQNEGDRRFYIKKNSLYFGLEYAHDITLTANGTELKYADDEIALNYEVVNQLGNKGYLDQNVDFLVMNTDRTEILTDTGIIVTDNGDGTAIVSVDPFTAIGGEYDIVAYNAANRMAKGVRVTVKESDVISALTVSEFSGSTVTATAKILNKTSTPLNAVLVIIMVDDDNEIVDIATEKVLGITSGDGVKTYTKALTATDLTKVTKAKAFLLDCGTEAQFELFDTTLVELALSRTITK